MVWTLAARNAAASRHRSLLVVLSLSLASLMLVTGASLATSLARNVERNLRRGFAGDLQLFHAENRLLRFIDEVPIDFVPIQRPGIVLQTLREDRDVLTAARRVNASGIILTEGRSAPVVLVGIDPEVEASTLDRLVASGADGFRGILLGDSMARRLDATSGDEVTVLIPTDDGLFEGDLFTVSAVYQSPGLPLLDQFIAFVPLPDLELLIGDQGLAHSIVLHLREGADPGAVRTRLRQSMSDAGFPLKIWTWEELAGDLLGIARAGRYMAESALLFLVLVVTLGVGNMLLILILGRSREIGLMRALGTPRRRVIETIIAEVALVSSVSAALGTAVGALLVTIFGRVGIPAVSEAMTYAFGGARFYPQVHLTDLLLGFLVVTVVGTAASLWPALRASAADPAEVMRGPA